MALLFGAIFSIVAFPVLIVAGLNLLGQLIVALLLAPLAWLIYSIFDRPLSAISRVSERIPKWQQWIIAVLLYALTIAIGLIGLFLSR